MNTINFTTLPLGSISNGHRVEVCPRCGRNAECRPEDNGVTLYIHSGHVNPKGLPIFTADDFCEIPALPPAVAAFVQADNKYRLASGSTHTSIGTLTDLFNARTIAGLAAVKWLEANEPGFHEEWQRVRLRTRYFGPSAKPDILSDLIKRRYSPKAPAYRYTIPTAEEVKALGLGREVPA